MDTTPRLLMFDWQAIYRESLGSPVEIVKILRMLTTKYIPKNSLDPLYKYYCKDLTGSSFLVHPDMLIYNEHQYSHKDISLYVAFASCRKLADWLVFGKTTLNVLEAPVTYARAVEHVSENPLMSLEGDEISFKYEDSNNCTIH